MIIFPTMLPPNLSNWPGHSDHSLENAREKLGNFFMHHGGNPGYEPWIWTLDMNPGYEPWIWTLDMNPGYEPWIWTLDMNTGYEPWIWTLDMAVWYHGGNPGYGCVVSWWKPWIWTLDMATLDMDPGYEPWIWLCGIMVRTLDMNPGYGCVVSWWEPWIWLCGIMVGTLLHTFFLHEVDNLTGTVLTLSIGFVVIYIHKFEYTISHVHLYISWSVVHQLLYDW